MRYYGNDEMNKREHRLYQRCNTEMRAVLYVKDKSIPAIMIDIGKCGIGLILEKEISVGTDIQIRIKHVGGTAIQGIVRRIEKIRETPGPLYRMGIETEDLIFLNKIEDIDLPQRSDSIKSLLSPKRPVKNILFLDDEKPICKLFKETLEKFGYEVTVGFNGEEGLELFRKHPADLVITDIFMPKKDGHTLIMDITNEFPEVNIFAITGMVSFDPIMELNIANKLGAQKTFQKPVKFKTLLGAIRELTV